MSPRKAKPAKPLAKNGMHGHDRPVSDLCNSGSWIVSESKRSDWGLISTGDSIEFGQCGEQPIDFVERVVVHDADSDHAVWFQSQSFG
jgi:hypothetical protein